MENLLCITIPHKKNHIKLHKIALNLIVMKLSNACEITKSASLLQVYKSFISVFLLYQLTVFFSLLTYIKKSIVRIKIFHISSLKYDLISFSTNGFNKVESDQFTFFFN